MRDIVLAHSDHKLADLYESRLKADFRIHKAVDGISGVRLIRHHKPHLVLAQYELPWLSGIGVLKFVRQHPELSATPVFILSHQSPVPEALSLAANGWIQPSKVSVDELMQKIYYELLTKIGRN